MKLDLSKIELEQYDLNVLHDVILGALGIKNLTDEELILYWNKLPDDIKLDALKYEIGDTPTRDAMYVWFKENIKL